MTYRLIGPNEPLYFIDPVPDRIEDWAEARQAVVSRLQAFMGEGPPEFHVEYEVKERKSRDGVEFVKLIYCSRDGDSVPAYLLFPSEAEETDAVYPAVIALHQTVPEGKSEAVGKSGSPDMHYGLELAKRGYVVLAPDVLTAGERIYEEAGAFQSAPFYKANPNWSMMGKMLLDHRSAIDLLEALPYVDPERIAAIGHSLGGYNALFAGAFDKRVRAVVCSCGLSPLSGDANPGRWGRRDWFTHFPAMNGYLEQALVPFEFHEVAALISPRSLYVYAAREDAIFPHWEAVQLLGEAICHSFEKLGSYGKVRFVMGDGGHAFPSPERENVYAWLKEQLER